MPESSDARVERWPISVHATRSGRALLLVRDAMHVLMESTPRGLSLPAVRDRILAVPGVVGVHDLHARHITAGLP